MGNFMDSVNQLICYLIAIASYAKDIHYSCKGEAFYGKHLLADRIYDGLYDSIDSLIEVCILGNDEQPLPYSEYNVRAANLVRLISNDDKENFKQMKSLLEEALLHMQKMLQEEGNPRAEVSLVDGIAQDLQGKLGLVNRQVRD